MGVWHETGGLVVAFITGDGMRVVPNMRVTFVGPVPEVVEACPCYSRTGPA